MRALLVVVLLAVGGCGQLTAEQRTSRATSCTGHFEQQMQNRLIILREGDVAVSIYFGEADASAVDSWKMFEADHISTTPTALHFDGRFNFDGPSELWTVALASNGPLQGMPGTITIEGDRGDHHTDCAALFGPPEIL